MLSKTDYRVLESLRKNRCYSKLIAFTIKQIIDDSGLSISTVRRSIKILISLNYIDNGAKAGHSNTFYMTDKGKKEYASAIGKSNL